MFSYTVSKLCHQFYGRDKILMSVENSVLLSTDNFYRDSKIMVLLLWNDVLCDCKTVFLMNKLKFRPFVLAQEKKIIQNFFFDVRYLTVGNFFQAPKIEWKSIQSVETFCVTWVFCASWPWKAHGTQRHLKFRLSNTRLPFCRAPKRGTITVHLSTLCRLVFSTPRSNPIGKYSSARTPNIFSYYRCKLAFIFVSRFHFSHNNVVSWMIIFKP